MRHNVSEVSTKFQFLHTAILRLYCEYRVSRKTLNQKLCGHKKDLERMGPYIPCKNTESQLTYNNYWHGCVFQSLSELFNGSSLIWVSKVQSCTAVGCTAQRIMLCLSGCQHRFYTSSVDNGNTFFGLTRVVSNSIDRMDMYGYWKILINPWTLHVRRWYGGAFVRACTDKFMKLLLMITNSSSFRCIKSPTKFLLSIRTRS